MSGDRPTEPLGRRLRLKLASGDLASIPSKRALQVWLGFLAHAGSDGTAYPSDATLAKAFGVNEKTIRRGKAQLIEAGHLENTDRRKGERGPIIYRINLQPNRTPIVQPDHGPTGQYTNPNRTVLDSQPDSFRALTGHPLSNESVEAKESTSSINRPVTPDKRARSVPVDAGAAFAALSRIGADVGSMTLPPGVTADTVIRHWLTITGKPGNPLGVLVSRLRSGKAPGKQPTAKAIAQACRDGVIVSITLDDKAVDVTGETVGANSTGVVIDGKTLATSRIVEAVFA